MGNRDNFFIKRKFKNIETGEIVDFETVVNGSNISVILGEPASGKTYQLKNYKENSENTTFLKPRHVIKNKSFKQQILLFDSIDEALISYLNIKDDLIDYIEENRDKKFIITCRYLEWKKYFEEELKKLDKDLKIYEIVALSKEEINKLLKEEDREDFWKFIEDNHLESLLKNVMIIFHLIENFRNYDNNSNYINIYEKIIKEYIVRVGEDRDEEDTNRDLDELVLIASSLATYMILNRLSSISSTNLKKVASECYKIDGKSIVADDLKAILKTPLFEKNGDEFTFFHKSIQEYLTAYFINYKKLNSKTIKKIFAHKLGFYEEFEEVIIYLTNIQPKLFNEFIEIDPFIFRRHPSLTEEQQEKLLLTIIDKLRNSEYFIWNRESYLFYNTTIVRFDKIKNKIYSLIEDKNIENSQNSVLIEYIMRLFSYNYSKKLEDFIFEILSNIIDNKEEVRRYIYFSYNMSLSFNKRLFRFMKDNNLFDSYKSSYVMKSLRDHIENIMFFTLTKETKGKSKESLYLLDYLYYPTVVFYLLKEENILNLQIIKNWCLYLNNNKITIKNIQYIITFTLENYEIDDNLLKCLININNLNNLYGKKIPYKGILEIYLEENDEEKANKIKNFIHSYLDLVETAKKDVIDIQQKYPIEKYFIKISKLLEDYPRKSVYIYKHFLSLNNKEQLNKILKDYDKYIKENHKYIITLFVFNHSEKFENLIFKTLKECDKVSCRKYIEYIYTFNTEKYYSFNLRIFNLMKEKNLFEKNNNLECYLFSKLKFTQKRYIFKYISKYKRLSFPSIKSDFYFNNQEKHDNLLSFPKPQKSKEEIKKEIINMEIKKFKEADKIIKFIEKEQEYEIFFLYLVKLMENLYYIKYNLGKKKRYLNLAFEYFFKNIYNFISKENKAQNKLYIKSLSTNSEYKELCKKINPSFNFTKIILLSELLFIIEKYSVCYIKDEYLKKIIEDYYSFFIFDKIRIELPPPVPYTNPVEVVKEIWDKDIRNWIESEGAYKFINELAKKEQNTNAEDFIQKTIEPKIEIGFLKRKYEDKSFITKREEQLLDDKRLDFTIFYPPFSIVVELKLSHNSEAKPTRKEAKNYISKLEQYIKGSKSDFALFVILNVKEEKDKFDRQIEDLKRLYKDKENIEIIGLNCVK